ncbi:DUF349 domain-containing protein [Microbacterium sp. YY-01]|uniref:DUF349 domain-containing protein n=1 Tax=Microbacterium sp. YY-01 TaxID=3421634 RepID=UPI003D182CF4
MSAEQPTPSSMPVPGPPKKPVPAPPAPPVSPAPPAAAEPASDSAATTPDTASTPTATASEWGTVTDDGTVSVHDNDQWRVVGQFPDGTPAEALAYFQRKYDDLAFKVQTLEQRHQGGGAAASELTKQAKSLSEELVEPAAVGDLAALRSRVDALIATLAEASEEEARQAKAALDQAIAERTTIVERAEALAAQDFGSVKWKAVTAEINDLFTAWQSHQQTAPRLPKNTAQQLWKRFRNARATIDRHRRAFYAELDETHKAARQAKNRLIERAEALAPRGEEGIPAYRTLLDEWKTTGRAGRKADDALWARFKAAGDVLYGARAERDAAEAADSLPRIEAREALLEQAQAVADEKDLAKARALLTRLQRQWDEVGRIFPRDKERALDDRLRAIEQALKSREQVDWKRNNPETKARADGMTRQLNEAIEKLEAELAAAQKAGDKKAIAAAEEALNARRSWLQALGR